MAVSILCVPDSYTTHCTGEPCEALGAHTSVACSEYRSCHVLVTASPPDTARSHYMPLHASLSQVAGLSYVLVSFLSDGETKPLPPSLILQLTNLLIVEVHFFFAVSVTTES